MMGNMKCRCGHHKVGMLLSGLSWLAAIAFFFSAIKSQLVFGFDAGYYFMVVVVFGFLNLSMKGCPCCCGSACCGTCGVEKKGEMMHGGM